MVSAFDQRIVQVGIEFPGGTSIFEGLSIYASGRKYGSALMNECEIRIYNLTKDLRNYILTQASPFSLLHTSVKVTLDVGRESYGTFRLFEGNCISCGTTQPPDIGIFLRSLTNNFATGVVVGATQSSVATTQTIAQAIADSMGLVLDFQATNKNIENYSYSGSAAGQIKKLNEIGGVVAFIDNQTLTVIDSDKARKGEARAINSATGMIGVPQFTDKGVIVKMMLDNTIELGSSVNIESQINPAANGEYKVQTIGFDLASRDQQFWYTLDCISPIYYNGTL